MIFEVGASLAEGGEEDIVGNLDRVILVMRKEDVRREIARRPVVVAHFRKTFTSAIGELQSSGPGSTTSRKALALQIRSAVQKRRK